MSTWTITDNGAREPVRWDVQEHLDSDSAKAGRFHSIDMALSFIKESEDEHEDGHVVRITQRDEEPHIIRCRDSYEARYIFDIACSSPGENDVEVSIERHGQVVKEWRNYRTSNGFIWITSEHFPDVRLNPRGGAFRWHHTREKAQAHFAHSIWFEKEQNRRAVIRLQKCALPLPRMSETEINIWVERNIDRQDFQQALELEEEWTNVDS